MNIKIIQTQKVLSQTNISLADYVINPYRGCSFGCAYCYTQQNKNIQGTPLDEQIVIKRNAPEILVKELRYIRPKRILLGSTTECFQYCESEYRITARILEILNTSGIPYTILTKSHLIQESIDLIAKNPDNKIYYTFNCAEDSIIRLLEKKSPDINQRLETIQALNQANINVRIHIGPFIPYLSNIDEILKRLPEGNKEIDIEFYHHKMGDFEKMLTLITQLKGTDIAQKLSTIYQSKQNYEKYAKRIKEVLLQLKKTSPYTFYLIVPDYDKYYESNIDYSQAL